MGMFRTTMVFVFFLFNVFFAYRPVIVPPSVLCSSSVGTSHLWESNLLLQRLHKWLLHEIPNLQNAGYSGQLLKLKYGLCELQKRSESESTYRLVPNEQKPSSYFLFIVQSFLRPQIEAWKDLYFLYITLRKISNYTFLIFSYAVETLNTSDQWLYPILKSTKRLGKYMLGNFIIHARKCTVLIEFQKRRAYCYVWFV